MKFARTIHGELPFTLNLPDGNYPVPLEGENYVIHVRNSCVAAAIGKNDVLVNNPQQVAEQLGDRLASTHTWELRTIVSHHEECDVDSTDYAVPTEQDLPDNMRFHIIDQMPYFRTAPQEIESKITEQLGLLVGEMRTQFETDTVVRLTWKQRYPESGTERFCRALNQMMRLYMVAFNDFFVEEVLPQHFSNGLFGGLQVTGYFDGRYINHLSDSGGRFPYIVRRPWFQHAPEQVTGFRERLAAGTPADPVTLLSVRARAFLMRGIYRSAMTEASAALDLSVSRKIREGYRLKGKLDSEIDTTLKTKIRFKERAKDLLEEATGQGAHTFDNILWTDVCKHKENRHGVAHAAAEPTREGAEGAVEDMLRLADLVNNIKLP